MQKIVENILVTFAFVILAAIMILITGLAVLGAVSIWMKVLSFF